jgi:N-acetylmuramoyl-L-alanine amidase
MSKFHGLVLTFLALLLYALPAQAGKLVYWRFESAQNRLVFTTDDRVQPTAQLIPNPTLASPWEDQPSINPLVVSSVMFAWPNLMPLQLV